MKFLYPLAIALTLSILTISCTKITNRGIEIEYKTDTLFAGAVAAKDTILIIDTAHWNAYSYSTRGLVKPSDSTYFKTTEGITFLNKNYRSGIRLQTKGEIDVKNKTIYFKYKMNALPQAIIRPMLKYDPLTEDIPSLNQGVYFSGFSLKAQYGGISVIQNDVWYYARVKPLPGTDDYVNITSVNNYDNIGGTIIREHIIPIFTKSGYISLAFWDNHSTDGYAVLGECKILSK